jgi:hypothetical protein
MPWEIQKRGDKWAVVKQGTDEVEGTHATEEEAKAQLRALYANEPDHASLHSYQMAFEPFAKMEPGKAIKLLPTGTWYRGKRVLELTADRLRQIEDNFKKGLPRFRVGFSLDHAEDRGKVGDIEDVAYMGDAPDGPGLYATRYNLTERGVKALEMDGYDAVSAEVVWTLNGATYQDPQTGSEHDNVLVGAAFTPRPFFGHSQVALYSADQKKGEAMADEMTILQRIEAAIDNIRTHVFHLPTADEFAVWDTAFINDLPDSAFLFIEDGGEKDADGKTVPRGLRHFPVRDTAGAVDLPHLRNALARIPQSALSPEQKANALGKAHAMAKDKGVGEAAQTMAAEEAAKEAEKMAEALEAEKFTEQLKAKDVEIERLTAEAKEASGKAEKLEAESKAAKLEQRKGELKAEAEAFKALPMKTEEYVEKFVALEEKDPETAKWLKAQFAAFDVAMKEAGLLREIGSEREGDLSKADLFTARITAKMTELKCAYAEAFDIVQHESPDLAKAYIG